MGALFDKTVCIEVGFSRFGQWRKLPMEKVEVQADKTRLRAGKKILDCPQLDAIQKADTAIKKWLESKAIPCPLRDSTLMLPFSVVDTVEGRLNGYQTFERPGLVEAFMGVYREYEADARVSLDTVYDPTNYPDEEEVRGEFEFTYRYVDFSVPGKLSSVSALAASRAMEQAETEIVEATEAVKAMMLATLQDLVAHLAERLKPEPDGKKKRLYDSAITNLTEFLDGLVPKAEAADATELIAMGEKCKAILKGVDMDMLRDNAGMKAWVQQKMEVVKSEIDGLVQPVGRKIDMG